MKTIISVLVATFGWWVASLAQAQLSNNLSVGNPIAIALANAVTARPPGTDAIHFNPAGLASVRNELTQYKIQLATMRLEGTISGEAPGQPFGGIQDPAYAQDPLLQGQLSRPVSSTASNLFLPFWGHVEMPFLAVPGYGKAFRLQRRSLVFANSAVAISSAGFRRDETNIGAYNGYKMGQLTLAYLNPTLAFDLGERVHVGISVGLAWTGLGISTNLRSVVQSLAQVDTLLNALDPTGNLEVSISPYSDVGQLELELEDPLVITTTLGLLWDVTDWLTLGLTYRSPGNAKMKGDYQVRYQEDFLDTVTTLQSAGALLLVLDGEQLAGEPIQRGKLRSESTVPQTLSGGLSVLITPRLRANLDVRWVDYSVIDQIELHYDQPVDYLSVASMINFLFRDSVDGFDWVDPRTKRLRRNYQDIVDWALGIEYQYSHRLQLRIGIEPRTSPIREQWMDLMQPLGDAWYYGAGFGYVLEEGTLDVGLGYMKTDILLAPGESRIANSMTEGETNSVMFRGMRIAHTAQAFVVAASYSKRF